MTKSAFQALNGAAEDFETRLPLIPSGEFTSFTPYAKHSTQPANVRKLPVLRAGFDSSPFDMTCAETYCGYGAVQIGEAVALAFRIQSGADALFWLANPADTDVWNVLDQWAAAKRMVLAAEFGEKVLLVVRDFHLPPPMRLLRQAVQAEKRVTPAFLATMSRAVLLNELVQFVSSDLGKHPTLKNIQARIVRTSITGGVAVMLNHGDVPANPVAAAAAELAKNMLAPHAMRH